MVQNSRDLVFLFHFVTLLALPLQADLVIREDLIRWDLQKNETFRSSELVDLELRQFRLGLDILSNES